MKNPMKFKKGERKILEAFYKKLKGTLQRAHHYSETQIDFEVYRYILQHTKKPPKDYIKIFYAIPESNRQSILKYLGYKTDTAFRESFAKQLNVYRQSTFRREDEEDWNTGDKNE
jgi:hypothetical protein